MSETSIAEAKAQLTRLIHRAEQGETVHITRRGKPVAVLLARDEYVRLLEGHGQRSFWALVTEMREDPEFEPVDWPKETVDAWRDRRPAPVFEWPE